MTSQLHRHNGVSESHASRDRLAWEIRVVFTGDALLIQMGMGNKTDGH
ncbi:MAG: hypothetical protein GY703_04780 [Gammaproteobacteria bacterium]|nr:hypothetical protein [Gammaproteobacteria bacterium]